jgi:hypothetical protein
MVRFEMRVGTKQEAETLFSYPNDGHEQESLEATVLHYMRDSLQREAAGVGNVSVTDATVGFLVVFEHSDAAIGKQIVTRYESFFSLGLKGFSQSKSFQKTGKWSARWKFFLPLGLPLEFGAAVEIMDFPPISLIKKQDYLNSKTTSRWWELLQLNGVPQKKLARFSCIVDIVPVAAPANDGKTLDSSGIYGGPFDDYSLGLLELFSDRSNTTNRRPLMALGLPIRKWIQRLWGQTLGILNVGTLALPSGETAPVIASNHPSFFFYAASAYDGQPNADAKNLAAGLAVMKQDIVAAAWHAELGANPEVDPFAALAASTAKWASREPELIDLVHRQAGIPKPLVPMVAIETVRTMQPSPETLAELERQFHYESNARAESD